jgi:hypothetical protein
LAQYRVHSLVVMNAVMAQGSVKSGHCLVQVISYHLLNNYSAPWNLVNNIIEVSCTESN